MRLVHVRSLCLVAVMLLSSWAAFHQPDARGIELPSLDESQAADARSTSCDVVYTPLRTMQSNQRYNSVSCSDYWGHEIWTDDPWDGTTFDVDVWVESPTGEDLGGSAIQHPLREA